MAGKTKEERYLLRIYELALKAGDLQHPLNRYDAGKTISLSPKGVDAICHVLMRANFLKKGENPDQVVITKRGEELALTLLRGG